MPYVDLNNVAEEDRSLPLTVMDGIMFAQTAVQFAALAIAAGQRQWSFPRVHLHALAIELGFQSLALRSGAFAVSIPAASDWHWASLEVHCVRPPGSTAQPVLI